MPPTPPAALLWPLCALWCVPAYWFSLQDRPLPSVVFTQWGVGPWPHGDRFSLESEWLVVPRRGRPPSPKLQPPLAPGDRLWRGADCVGQRGGAGGSPCPKGSPWYIHGISHHPHCPPLSNRGGSETERSREAPKGLGLVHYKTSGHGTHEIPV